MSTSLPDDSEYPYSARYGDSQAHFPAEVTFQLERSRFLWRWLARLGITAAILFFTCTAIIGTLTFQTLRRAWLVAELEKLGCNVTYAHQLPTATDPVPAFLREELGDNFWSEVREVSYHDFSANKDQLSPDGLRALCAACSRLPSLRSFRLNSIHFSCQLLANWPHLSRLEELSVDTAELTDPELAILTKMRRLEKLHIGEAKLSAAAIPCLASLPNLETLSLSSVEFAAPLQRPASGFSKLKRLESFDAPNLTDDFVISLGPLPALEEVVFNKSPLHDKSLGHFVSNGKLRTLIMNDSHVTDAGLRLLNQCPSIDSLHISGSEVTDEGIQTLAGRSLSSLSLCKTSITDESFRTFSQLPNLQILFVDETKVTGIGVAQFQGRTPGWMSFDGAALSPEGVAAMSKCQVVNLYLSNTQLDDTQLLLLVGNDAIQELHITGTKVSVNGLRAFYQARKQRLEVDGRTENLIVECEFPDVVEEFIPRVQ